MEQGHGRIRGSCPTWRFVLLAALVSAVPVGCFTVRARATVSDAPSSNTAETAFDGAADQDSAPGLDVLLDRDEVSPDTSFDASTDIADVLDDQVKDAARDASSDASADASADTSPDAPAACPVGQVRCGVACVSTGTDRAHCGACSSACPAGALECAGGRCVVLEQLAAGGGGTCARWSNGTVWCWGRALASARGTTNPSAVPGIADARQIALSGNGETLCFRTSADAIHCMGLNYWGQAGAPPPPTALPGCQMCYPSELRAPAPVAGLNSVSHVVAGTEHFCALRHDGTVACWGYNIVGQIGQPRPTPPDPMGVTMGVRSSAAPLNVPGVVDGTTLGAAGYHTCVRSASGATLCWGNDYSGEISGRVSADPLTAVVGPTPVTGLPSDAAFSPGGGGHLCAWGSAGTLHCWGNGSSGQVGNGVASTSGMLAFPPTAVGGIAEVRSAAVGRAHSCAVAAPGSTSCWGDNALGQLGDGTRERRTRPTTVIGVADAIEVAAGAQHTCVRLRDGTVRCWGDNSNRTLGAGPTALPATVPGLAGVVSHCHAGSHACAVLSDGHVRCWGDNSQGQLGLGTTASRLSPTEVPGLTDATRVSCQAGTTCTLHRDATVRCWGANVSGGAVPGMGSPLLAPTVVPMVRARDVFVGRAHSCAILTSGAAACWGANGFRQLGDGTSANRAVPVAVMSLSNVTSIAPGTSHTCAVAGSGDVFCWGLGTAGVVGSSASSVVESPTQVIGPSGATSVRCSHAHCCATTETGGPWCWGDNAQGQRGLMDRAVSRAPARSGSLAGRAIDVVGTTTYVVREDGSVVFVGTDLADQDGSDPRGSTAPMTLTGVAAAAEIAGTCARRGDGTLMCWGDNSFGQHGTGRTSSDPVTVRFR